MVFPVFLPISNYWLYHGIFVIADIQDLVYNKWTTICNKQATTAKFHSTDKLYTDKYL